jgi:N-acylethanolamine-hydrolysing acid amidase
MMRLAHAACLLASASADFVTPEFTLDMDLPAYERWAPIGQGLLDARGYEYTWKPLHEYLENALPRERWLELEPLWANVLSSYPESYQEEVRAFYKFIAEEQGTNWTLGQVTMVQLFYEVEDACTSIVAQHSNGTIFHGRNLDYGLPGLQNFTATITVVKDGKPVTRGTMYVGYLGFLTGHHILPDGTASWSVSLNERFIDGKNITPYVPTIKAFLAGVQNVGFTLRDALAEQPDYTAATALLKDVPLPSPSYLTIGGVKKNEGVVITRNRNGTATAAGTGRGYWEMDADKGHWYRLETNFDNWWPDLLTDGRRKAARNGMEALGQDKADAENLFALLSTPPVLAKDTTYTAMMINEAGYYSTTAREADPAQAEAVLRERLPRTAAALQEVVEWYRQQSFYEAPTIV